MKYIYLILIFLTGVCGCNLTSYYDKGFDAGYENEKKSFLQYVSKNYREGYEEGMGAYYYHEGYKDAVEGQKSRYPDIPEYMEGYSAKEEAESESEVKEEL